jgi:hypothetical protein
VSRASKVDAIAVLGLAFVFYLFFQLGKQLPSLAAVNASADDPYDAIGSFAMLAAGFLGLLSAFRVLRGRQVVERAAADAHFLFRAEMATVLVVSVALGGDAVALGRHPEVWIGRPAGLWYVAALVVVSVLAALIGLRVHRAVGAEQGAVDAGSKVRAGVTVAACALVLAVYPEGFRQSIPGALATVVVGAILLFAPTRALLLALVPASARASDTPAPVPGAHARRACPWVLAALAGALVGLGAVAAEMGLTAPGPPPAAGRAFVVAVYVGLSTAGIMLGYGFLGGPLGLFRRTVGRG